MSQNRLSAPKLEYSLQQVCPRRFLLWVWPHIQKASRIGDVQLCELRVEVKPGKAVFITVSAELMVQTQSSPACQPLYHALS